MAILGKKALYDTIRSIDSSTFTGSYQKVGSILSFPAVCLKIVNNSGVLVTVSFDGVNDHDIYPASSFSIYDYGSDAQSTSGDSRLALSQGTQIWAKGTASTGSVYVVLVYQGG